MTEKRFLRIESLEDRVTPTADLMAISDFDTPLAKDLLVPVSLVSDPGTEVTYTVTSNQGGVAASLVNRQRSLQLDVTGTDEANQPFSGRLTLALFEDAAPLATGRIITLTERPDGPGDQGNYDGSIFHRIVDGFVIQGGDFENGNGTGGSNLGNFADEIRPNLTFNSPGLLAMANSGPNTNDSQFFVTETAEPPLDQPNFLNGRHTIFGILTGGFDTYQKIINTPVGVGDAPTNPVTIVDAEIVTDLTRGVVRISPQNNFQGTGTITVTADDGTGPSQTTFDVSFVDPSPSDQDEVTTFAVGAGTGSAGQVQVRDGKGNVQFDVTPFVAAPGGVRVVTADLTRDGVAELVVGTGPGLPSGVLVINGATQKSIGTLDAFEPSFLGGIYIAAGDITGDGVADVAISPDEGGGPRVRIYNGATGQQIADDFFIDDPNFRGGARVAMADINGDGVADVLVAAGFGGGPRVSIYDGTEIAQGNVSEAAKITGDFFVFEQTLRNGVFIAGGDVNGDGRADLVAGGGPGGGPRVFILDGASLVSGSQVQAGNFFAGDVNNRGGVPVAVKDLNGDRFADVVTGAGANATPTVRLFDGSSIAPDGTPSELDNFLGAAANFLGGINVG